MTDQLDLDGLDGWGVTHHGIASRDELELAIVRLAADDAALAYRLQGALSSLITRLRAAEAATAAAGVWQDISTAPRDGTRVFLWAVSGDEGRVETGSWRVDEGFASKDEMWLDDSYDDFSCGFASNPLSPTHWRPLFDPPSTPVAENA